MGTGVMGQTVRARDMEVPRPLPPGGLGGTSFCFSPVSASCPTTSPCLHTVGQGLSGSETRLNGSAFTPRGQGSCGPFSLQRRWEGRGPQGWPGGGDMGKRWGLTPGWRWSLLLSFYGPVVISWRAPLTGLAILRPKLRVCPLVSTATLYIEIGGSLQGHCLRVSRSSILIQVLGPWTTHLRPPISVRSVPPGLGSSSGVSSVSPLCLFRPAGPTSSKGPAHRL